MQTHDHAVPISKKPFLPAGIVKRDGQRVAFDPRRIAVALARAGLASGEFDDDLCPGIGPPPDRHHRVALENGMVCKQACKLEFLSAQRQAG